MADSLGEPTDWESFKHNVTTDIFMLFWSGKMLASLHRLVGRCVAPLRAIEEGNDMSGFSQNDLQRFQQIGANGGTVKTDGMSSQQRNAVDTAVNQGRQSNFGDKK